MSKFSKQYKDSQNKSKWISNKIDKLVSEGKPKKQAIAISNAMWNSRKADGGPFYGDKPLKKMQDGPYPTRSMEGVVIPFMPGQEDNDYYTQYFEQQKLKMPGQEPTDTEEDIFKREPIKSVMTEGFQEQVQKKPTLGSLEDEPGRKLTKVNTEYTEDNLDKNTTEDLYNNPNTLGSIESNFYNLGMAKEMGNKGLQWMSGAGIGAGILDTALGSARNYMSGKGQARRAQDAMDERREELRDTASGVNRVQYVKDGGEYYADGGDYESYGYGGKKKMYQQGGEVDQDRILTGEVLTGVSGNNQSVEPNTEIEDGEYVLSRDGQSIKVEGKKHSQGGEDVELQDGDKVISDNLKLKGANAKAVRDKFDIKAKAKDTYATVVDKVYKKIGLDKLIKEEEQVISRIRKQEEKLGEGATKDLNLQLLYKKKDKIGEEKQKLEEQRQNVLNEVYNMQEASKPKEKTSQQEMKKGGEYKKMQGGEEEGEEDFTAENEKVYLGLSEALKEVPEGQSLKNVEGYEVYGDVTKEDLLNTIKQNTWYDFTDFKPTKENTLKFQKEYNKRVKDGAKLKEDGKFGEQTASAYLPWVTEMEEEIDDSFLEGQPKESEPSRDTDEVEEENQNQGQFQGFQGRPDQSVLPPSGVDSQLKANRRYDRIDPNLMSPDQIIQENERRAQAAIKSAQQLPDSQRAAVIAQITAQTQSANQQAISQVDASNTQILNTTEAQNAQIQAREQDAAVLDALSFEKRQQTAESITDENVRGFLDYNRKVNLQNFNDARRQNTINRAFENFNLDAQGNIINEGGYDIDYRNYLMWLRRQGRLANAPQKTTKKKSE